MRIESNRCTFHCKMEGAANRPWLTLSHAAATDMSMWDELIPYLEKHYRILRYDARGHGASEAPDEAYSLDMMCRDVVGLLDALDIRQTHFLGLSMGGMVGLGLALDYSERFSSVIVCDARSSATDEYRNAWIARMEQVAAGGIEAIVEPSIQRWFTDQTLRTAPALVDRVRTMILRTPASGYRGTAAALMGLDYEKRLPDIRIPVLYVVGQEDQGAPPAVMLSMHRQTAGSRFVGIPYAGHLSVLERPEVFATSVLGFLNEMEAAETSLRRTVAAI